jgi:hypothetical protein
LIPTRCCPAQFIDAFRIAVDDAALDARHAAEKMTARGPR